MTQPTREGLTRRFNVHTVMAVKVTFDPSKRAKALAERGLDFARAGEIFAGRYFTAPDLREEYGEYDKVLAARG